MPTNRNAAPVATADAAPAQQRNEDLVLYKAIADRVDAGQDYYAVAADELRRGNYPLKPFVTFRLPTLTFAASWLGPIGLLVVQWSLFAALMAAWWVRLEGQFDVDGRRLSAVMLAAAGIAVGLTGRYLYLHEMWAGALVSLSLALHRPERWGWSVVIAAIALAIRELALPYLLLMAALALWRRNGREVLAWSSVILLFAIAMLAQRAAVMPVVLPSDPSSPSWAALAGWAGMLRTFHLGGALGWLPAVAAAPIIILGFFGWASWKSTTGLAGFLMLLGYGLAFMLFGRPNNFYWGLMVTPALLIGLAFVPTAIGDLFAAARRREVAA